jgi:hypothetical protein
LRKDSEHAQARAGATREGERVPVGLLDAPSKTPVTDLFTFAVVVSVGLGVVGAAIGAAIGRIAARRD